MRILLRDKRQTKVESTNEERIDNTNKDRMRMRRDSMRVRIGVLFIPHASWPNSIALAFYEGHRSRRRLPWDGIMNRVPFIPHYQAPKI